jgi:hypothetical protein
MVKTKILPLEDNLTTDVFSIFSGDKIFKIMQKQTNMDTAQDLMKERSVCA